MSSSRILRRSLALPSSSTPASPNLTSPSPSSFVLGCKKLVLSYSEVQGSAKGMRSFLSSGLATQWAERYPGVEFVVKREEGRHPILRALYLNGRSKEICVRSLEPSSISQKVKLLLDSSGAKITQIRRPKVESTNESVRGIWSAFHEETR
ncbi:mitochondrial 54S ribosomal protein mL43 MRPL51 [Sporobolomyces salmoneus]|uniref:mitochondrial 54S ribosomal protein mL43 MRPL51 n=1 Tax=Sporobolomyces salmoneus TaxID=183962 RepID=UPI00317AC77B